MEHVTLRGRKCQISAIQKTLFLFYIVFTSPIVCHHWSRSICTVTCKIQVISPVLQIGIRLACCAPNMGSISLSHCFYACHFTHLKFPHPQILRLIFLEGFIQDSSHPLKFSVIFLASLHLSLFWTPEHFALIPFVCWSLIFSSNGHIASGPFQGEDYARKQNKTPHNVKKITNIWQALSSCRLCSYVILSFYVFLLCVILWQVVI